MENKESKTTRSIPKNSYLPRLIFLIGLIISGIIFRVFYLVQYSSSPVFEIPSGPDVVEYYDWAREILSGNLLWSELKLHSPAYPFYLASLIKIFQSNFFLIRLFQQILFLCSGILLFYFLFVRGVEDARKIQTGLLASTIWTFYPPLIYLSGELFSEALLIPLICAMTIFVRLALDNTNRSSSQIFCALFGLSSALSILTHPLSLFFVIANFAILSVNLSRSLNTYKRISYLIAAAGVFFIILAPFSVYNGINFGKFFPFQANSGFNLYLGNNANADGTCYVRPGPEWDKIHDEAVFIAEESGITKDQYFITKSVNFLIEKPLLWTGLFLKKIFLVWNSRELVSGADMPELRYFTAIQKWTSWSFAVLGFFGLAGLICRAYGRKFSSVEIQLLCLLGTFWLTQVITVTSSRYRAPILLAVIFFASDFLTGFRKNFESGKRVVCVCAMLVSLLVVCVFPAPKDFERNRAEACTILGEAYLKKGDLDKAEELLAQASFLDPNWSRNHNMLGMIYQKKGIYEEAIASFSRATNCLDSDR
nr:glycosyltransferase family 39 protein [Victivallales bacterium]